MEEITPLRSLTVRLLRTGWSLKGAFTESFAAGGDRQLEERPWKGAEGAVVYAGQIYHDDPTWTEFFDDQPDCLPGDLKSGGAGAVIFVPVGTETLAICFGHIHIALNSDAFVRQFGLKVTLNSVPRSQLRTLDLATPDAITFQKRVQASKDTDLRRFGVDVLRDLARVAGGTPSDTTFASFIAGKDSLSITARCGPSGLLSKLQAILKSYHSKNYQKDFPWVDNLKLVREKDLIAVLDKKLFDELLKIRSGKPSTLHMSPPEVVDYTEGSALHYNGFGSHGRLFNQIAISDYASELNNCKYEGDIADIKKKHRISSRKDGSEKFSEKWRIYDCFVLESSIKSGGYSGEYVIFSGDWYKINKKFKDSVEKYFGSVQRVSIIGKTSAKNEVQLIEQLELTRKDMIKLDQCKINPDGVMYANIEPCDFLSKDRHFIHLKDGDSSGPISHLWSQGVVSAEALISDSVVRKKLREKVATIDKKFVSYCPPISGPYIRSEYTIVYGIMRKPYADGSLDIPFFSKVSFQAAAQRIEQFGIPLALEIIEKPADEP